MRRVLLAAAALALLVLCACGAEEASSEGFRVYYLNRSDVLERLVPEYSQPPQEADIHGMVDFVLEALKSPQTEGNYSVLPAGVSVKAEVSGAVATVNFEGGLTQLSSIRRSVVISGVIRSLLGIDGLDYAYIKCDGEYIEPFYDRAVAAGMFVIEESPGKY